MFPASAMAGFPSRDGGDMKRHVSVSIVR